MVLKSHLQKVNYRKVMEYWYIMVNIQLFVIINISKPNP